MAQVSGYRFFALSLLLLLAFQVWGAQGRGNITLVSSLETRESPYGRWLDLIYRDAFARLGYDFQYQGYPGGRAPLLAEQGQVDGEIHRAASYQQQTRTLQRVPEPHFAVSYQAYAHQPGIQLQGWHSLQGTGYRVEFRRGAKLPEMMLGKVVAPDRLFAIATAEQGMGKLLKGRSDLYVEQTLIASQTLAALTRQDPGYASIYSAGVMELADSYVYLHERHQDLLAPLAGVIRQMKQDGTVARYEQQAMAAEGTSQP